MSSPGLYASPNRTPISASQIAHVTSRSSPAMSAPLLLEVTQFLHESQPLELRAPEKLSTKRRGILPAAAAYGAPPATARRVDDETRRTVVVERAANAVAPARSTNGRVSRHRLSQADKI